MLPTRGRHAGVERHHPLPLGSVDPNIRHRATVFVPMPATRWTYLTYSPCLNWCEERMATELRHTEFRGTP